MHATPRCRLSLGCLLLGSALLAVVLASPPTARGPVPTAQASSEPAAEDLEENRQLLEKWRADPVHAARLRHDLRAFLALPPDQQERLRRLDKDLYDEDSFAAARLLRVLERYVEWLERLPPADRQRVEATADATERLQLLKEMREREWIERLPRALREELEKLAPDQRLARIAELRQDERRRREEWQVAMRHWDELLQKRPQPARLADFPSDVTRFVQESLMPVLSPEEKKRLWRAEGRWPLFPRTLVELTDRHAIPLPGPMTGPSRYQDLPAEVQQRLPVLKNAPPPFVQKAEGRWPQYAIAVTELARKRKLVLPKQLGPARPQEFSTAIQEFLDKQLLPVLEPEEKNRLKRAEGLWPRFPRELLDLARKHYLQVPGMGLPGPPALWDKFRTKRAADANLPPEVPDRILLEFARSELSAEERASLVSFSDPATRERLKQEFIKRHPQEWQRLLKMDQQKRQRKAKAQE
jgi:hypothetical protein